MTVCGLQHLPALGVLASQSQPVSLGPTSPSWRQRPTSPPGTPSSHRVVATRWQSLDDRVSHVSAETPEDSHLVCIALRRMDIRLSVAGGLVHDGIVTPGTLQVTAPAVPAECIFRGAYDALHLHVSNGLLDEWASATPGGCNALVLADAAPSHDPVTERLGLALLAAEQLGSMFGPIYADSLSIAIVSRLLASRSGMTNPGRSPVAGLVKWRLNRAIEYVEAHLGEPINLADVAAAAGLTRMHFAAQFRAATGLRPHEYLLRRRVERAQQMLLVPSMPVVDVALEVGFQTQAHFTSVFKRIVGQPPHAWRRMQSVAA